MPILGNNIKGNIVSGLAIGVGATVLAPVVVPIVTSILKPLAKTLVKEGIVLYQKGTELVAEVKETAEDLVAEAKAEIEQESGSENFPVEYSVAQAEVKTAKPAPKKKAVKPRTPRVPETEAKKAGE